MRVPERNPGGSLIDRFDIDGLPDHHRAEMGDFFEECEESRRGIERRDDDGVVQISKIIPSMYGVRQENPSALERVGFLHIGFFVVEFGEVFISEDFF